jgi:hypothetical protein
MSKKYNGFPLEELRTLLLNGELIHENMEQEDYSILMDNEFEMPEPDNEVIRLCASALGKYDEYKELDKINIDISGLIKKHENSYIPNKRRKLKRGFLIAAAVIATLLATQLVASAMGFDIFGYILNWGKERLTVTQNPPPCSENGGDSANIEPTYETYESLSDIPGYIAALIPRRIIEDFEFAFASICYESKDRFDYSFWFETADSVTLTLKILNSGVETQIEKDDEFFEEYSVNGKDFTIYKNLEIFKVIWIEGGVLYDMGVNLPIEEVKSIIDSL